MNHLVLFFLFLGTASPQAREESVDGYLQRARELEKQSEFTAAEKVYQASLKNYPDNPDLLRALGGLYQQQSKFQAAVEVFNRVLKRAPLYPDVNFRVGVCYYAMNRYSQSADALAKELEGNPKDCRTRYYLALVLQASGKRVEAIQELENLL